MVQRRGFVKNARQPGIPDWVGEDLDVGEPSSVSEARECRRCSAKRLEWSKEAGQLRGREGKEEAEGRNVSHGGIMLAVVGGRGSWVLGVVVIVWVSRGSSNGEADVAAHLFTQVRVPCSSAAAVLVVVVVVLPHRPCVYVCVCI